MLVVGAGQGEGGGKKARWRFVGPHWAVKVPRFSKTVMSSNSGGMCTEGEKREHGGRSLVVGTMGYVVSRGRPDRGKGGVIENNRGDAFAGERNTSFSKRCHKTPLVEQGLGKKGSGPETGRKKWEGGKGQGEIEGVVKKNAGKQMIKITANSGAQREGDDREHLSGTKMYNEKDVWGKSRGIVGPGGGAKAGSL